MVAWVIKLELPRKIRKRKRKEDLVQAFY